MYDKNNLLLLNADAGKIPLADETVHCAIGSPPYYSLRAYEGDQARNWPPVTYSPMPGTPPVEVPAMHCALGHEPDPFAYVGHLVACFREVYRVLRVDGVCWIVMGDSYASTSKGENRTPETLAQKSTLGIPRDGTHPRKCTPANAQYSVAPRGKSHFDLGGLKQGDLMMIPHRLALALQADKWLVRNDCVFAKASPMPESVAGWRFESKSCGCIDRSHDGGQQKSAHNPDRQDNFGYHGGDIRNRQYGTPDPTCPDCHGTGRVGEPVLRKGSARHTRAHEFVLHLTKNMLYYTDHAKFKEDVHKVQERTATSGFLYNPKDGETHVSLQGMPETRQERILSQRQREGVPEEILGDGRQGKKSRISTKVSSDRTRQRSFQTIRNLREGQGKKSEIQPVTEGEGDEEASPCQADGRSRLSGKNASLLEEGEQAKIKQDSSGQVHQIPEGARSQTKEGQEVQEIREGTRSSKAIQCSTPPPSEGETLHTDTVGVEGNQDSAESSLLLLQETNEDLSTRSCVASEPGRSACEGEYSSGLSEMQCKEGQQAAKRNPRSVLQVGIEEELYQQFLIWRAEIENGNPLDVLTPKPESYPGQHYAVFPRSLISPLIQATCPKRCCPACGTGWAPVVEKGRPQARPDNPNPALPYTASSGHTHGTGMTTLHKIVSSNLLGYRPSCDCYGPIPDHGNWATEFGAHVPGTVLDPFVGSGTTLLVARELGLRAIGLDLSAEYLCEQAAVRVLERTPEGVLAELPMFEFATRKRRGG